MISVKGCKLYLASPLLSLPDSSSSDMDIPLFSTLSILRFCTCSGRDINLGQPQINNGESEVRCPISFGRERKALQSRFQNIKILERSEIMDALRQRNQLWTCFQILFLKCCQVLHSSGREMQIY